MWLTDWIRKVWKRMLPKNSIEQVLDIHTATSGEMQRALQIWTEMYCNVPPWKAEGVQPLNLPAAISSEFARLILTEFHLEVNGGQMGTYLNDQLQHQLTDFSQQVEKYCALGGIALKPYVAGVDPETGMPKDIQIDFVTADNFFPTAFDSNGDVIGAVFLQTLKRDGHLYTRLEYHLLEGTDYTITNRAFESREIYSELDTDAFTPKNRFAREIPLSTIPEWEGLSDEPVTIKEMPHPLFVYIKTPMANNIDLGSPIGVSVFSRAVEVIRDADLQYGRLNWEFKATEAGVFADESLFDRDAAGNPILPKGEERKFITVEGDGGMTSGPLLKPYTPAIRDKSIINGLNQHLMMIEMLCGLSYGTFSKAIEVDKTATELRMSKQRSYVAVSQMQQKWETGLRRLIDSMQILANLYDIVPDHPTEVTCTWGDSVLEDTEVEYQRRWSWVLSGRLKLEKFYAWYFGCSEEEAKDYIPKLQDFPPEN